jgi:3-phenylpropionate/trans-cinnamate dioxygenase ferredoxin subunit
MTAPGKGWRHVGRADDIDEEDVMRFDLGDKTYAVYNTENGFFATDGLCTHEDQHLADGLVLDDIIECPLHQGRFHIPTGKAKTAPVCIDLKTYPVQVVDGEIYLQA